MASTHALPLLVAAFVATIAVITDVRARRIPNWLTASGFLAGLLGNALLGGFANGGAGIESGAGSALVGALLGFGLLFPMYMLRVGGVGHAIGAGDVKLLAALGALLGPQALISVAIYGAMAGGVQAAIMLLQRGRLGLFAYETIVMRVSPSVSGIKAPYAISIAVGVLASIVLPPVVRF